MILLNNSKMVNFSYKNFQNSQLFTQKKKLCLSTEMNLQNFVVVKSYSYTNLLIGYGPNKEVAVSIFWCTKSKEYKMIFNGGNTAINAHTIMREQLQAHLNRHHNLSQIVHIIHETYQPLSSIAKLPIIPQLGIPVNVTFNIFCFIHLKHLNLILTIFCLLFFFLYRDH